MSRTVDTLLVVGLGLIGGSLVAALRGTGFARRITAYNRNRASLDYALGAGLIDAAPRSLEEAVAEAGLIVVGVPTLTVGAVFETIRVHGRPDVLITDVASVKGSVVQAAAQVFGQVPPRLVPGHPIAGAEKSGVEAARAGLFERHRVILTPLADTDAEALTTVEAMWRLTGAEVVRMEVAAHDRILALTSHLPHVLAFALVDSLARQSASDDIFRFAAGGFRDFTRIASSDAVMWRDIALANRGALLDAIDGFTVTLDALRAAVAAGDGATLEQVFVRARSARERYLRWLEQGIQK
ncbi:MAG: Cyclohexadienyl dehydrogenase [Pseudomonadales bacterium]|nr:Cyclohexadienyl dehydrogenase [Pseudomonadales bacterium]